MVITTSYPNACEFQPKSNQQQANRIGITTT